MKLIILALGQILAAPNLLHHINELTSDAECFWKVYIKGAI